MTNQKPTDPRIPAMLETLSRLTTGDWSARATPRGQADTLDQIINELNRLAETLSTQHTTMAQSEPRFEELLDVISGLAALDFSKKAHVGDDGTIIDAIAYGVNMLSEELAATVVSRAYVDNIIESMLDALVVIDQQGVIKTINRATLQLFGYEKEVLLDQSISILFAKPADASQILKNVENYSQVGSIEILCRTNTGQLFPASFSASLMANTATALRDIVCTIRDITLRKQAEEALRNSIAQEETIRAQQIALAELSTPLIPISDDVVVMPLIGAVDSRRAQQVLETLLQGISTSNARIAILDITGVLVVDTQVANALIQAAQAVKLLGAQVMLTGIRPEVAQTLVGLGINLRDITTHSTLQSGIAAVLGME